MIKYFSILFLGLVLIISCASKDEKLQNYKDYIKKVSDQIKAENGNRIIKVLGERRSIFSSYFIDNDLVFINEDVNIGNRGQSANQYYFKNNKLIYYNERTLLMHDDSLKIDKKTMINLELFLDGNEILESQYWIGNVQSVLVEKDIDNIIKHSKLLNDLAFKNRPRNK